MMDIESVTNVRQSLDLIKAGLPTDYADMFWGYKHGKAGDTISEFRLFFDHPTKTDPALYELPCWSVGKLIKLLPNPIRLSERKYYPHIGFVGYFSCQLLYVAEEDDSILFQSRVESLVNNLTDAYLWILKEKICKV